MVKVKHERVGLYIMPKTRNQLNLVKAQISVVVGRPLNQDETIQHLIETFNRARRNGHGAEHAQPEAHYA